MERAFPRAFVVGFDAPPSSPCATTTAASGSACHIASPPPSDASSSSSARTARSLLTMLLKESQGSSAGSSDLLHDCVDNSSDCDSQSESSWGDEAEDPEDIVDEGFEVSAPIPIVTAEPMKLLASYWCSTRALTNKRLQSEALRMK